MEEKLDDTDHLCSTLPTILSLIASDAAKNAMNIQHIKQNQKMPPTYYNAQSSLSYHNAQPSLSSCKELPPYTAAYGHYGISG